jgi:hypothetical protein
VKKYRRVEINAYRRRVTIVSGISGEWSRENIDAQPAETDDEVSLNNTDSCEPVEPDSPEGQLIIVEAVRSLERRLSPETRATICTGQNILAPKSKPNSFCLKLRSFYESICPKPFRLIERRNETLAQHTAKQSGKD